jgi:uncharacterized GH25 family protein
MTRRSLLGLLGVAFALLFVVALGYFVLSEPAPTRSEAVAPGMPVAPAAPGPEVAGAVEPARPEAPPAAKAVPAKDEKERAAVATQAEDELAEASWVHGFVRLPDGVPLGEVVHVVADGKSFRHRENHRVPIEGDGSFRVAFAKGTKSGYLKIEAQHLYLEPPLKVKVPDSTTRFELAPQLGGRIVGKLVPPPGALDAAKALADVEVSLQGWNGTGLGDFTQIERKSKVSSELTFALDGIPPGVDCHLSCDPKTWVAVSRNQVELLAGATKTIDLELEIGAKVSGKFLDASKAPAADVLVTAEVEHDPKRGWTWTKRTAKTAADGTFELVGITPGDLTLVATKKDHRELRHEIGKLDDGDVRADLELVIDGGHWLAGKVQWRDGKPASNATVQIRELEPESSGFSFSTMMGQSVKAGPDGSFRFLGLREGSYEITASAATVLEVAPGLNPIAAKRASKGPTWRVRQGPIEADREVLLTLEPSSGVHGVVVDDLGQPIRRYTLVAAKDGADHEFFMGGATQKVDSEDGSFEFEGLHEGAWSIVARTRGHFENEPAAVTVPGDGRALRLVLNRAGTLSGVVLDPDGEPAPKVSVTVEPVDEEVARTVRMSMERAIAGSDKTDASGKFTIRSSPIGAIEIVAKSPTHADSEPLVLDLAPGQALEGLTLTLRRGGRITGELHASAGSPGGRSIQLDSSGEAWMGASDTTTDANGRFSFDNVTPGTYQVVAEPDEAELERLVGSDEHDWEMRTALRQSAVVTVTDGGVEHVVLGAPPRAPLRISGVVRRGAAPVEGARVRFHSMAQSEESEDDSVPPEVGRILANARRQPKIAKTDASGRYEVVLETPGPYTCMVQSGESGTQASRKVDVTDAPAQTVDFELAGGRIAGRVLDPDGDPLEGVSLSLSREGSAGGSAGLAMHGNDDSDDEGRFQFLDLSPGTYSVVATPSTWRWNSGSKDYASARRDGIVVPESGSAPEIELRLMRGGSIEGVIRLASGVEVEDAQLSARDENGKITRSWFNRVSGDGRYRISNLAPGTWTVTAISGDEAVLDAGPARVTAGESAKLDLELRPGSRLEVQVTDGEEKRKVGASFELRDSRGRDVAGLVMQGPGAFGPLPAGRYLIRASNHSGKTAEKTVEVSGSGTQAVELAFGDS